MYDMSLNWVGITWPVMASVEDVTQINRKITISIDSSTRRTNVRKNGNILTCAKIL